MEKKEEDLSNRVDEDGGVHEHEGVDEHEGESFSNIINRAVSYEEFDDVQPMNPLVEANPDDFREDSKDTLLTSEISDLNSVGLESPVEQTQAASPVIDERSQYLWWCCF